MITTYDPRLNALGLPQYPPLPASLDAAKVEEIRRTVYIGNLDPKTVSGYVALRLRTSHRSDVFPVIDLSDLTCGSQTETIPWTQTLVM